jgi:hypothetical protein
MKKEQLKTYSSLSSALSLETREYFYFRHIFTVESHVFRHILATEISLIRQNACRQSKGSR